jgi:nicotinamide-nucleotide amidase
MRDLAEEVVRLLRDRGLTLGTVESATGGLISHLVTNVPGSSECFMGSIISYSNDAKTRLVGVNEESIARHGAVSAPVAEEMARRGRRVLRTDVCVADTGIAGPGGATPEKPVGLFYIGLSHRGGTLSRRHTFSGDRQENKRLAAEAALEWVRECLMQAAEPG